MGKVQGLDGLVFTRFLAALAVVCFHLGRHVPLIDDRPWSGVVMAGPVAVTYFFVLSGFVMAMVYGDLGLEGSRDFWRARLARIYPVYLLGLVFSIPADSHPVDWLLSLFLVQSWVPGYALSTNLVGWSLSVEVFFYALFPVLVLLARRIGLVGWCGAVAAVWLATQAWAVFATTHIAGPYGSPSHEFVHYSPLTYLACFLVGMATGSLVRRGAVALDARQASLLLLGSLALAAMALLVPWEAALPRTMGLLAPVFAASIVALYFLPSRWRASAPARLLGEASYALYILHWPISRLLEAAIMPSLGLSALGDFCVVVAALVGLSILVFLRIEKPARAALRRTARRRDAPIGYAPARPIPN